MENTESNSWGSILSSGNTLFSVNGHMVGISSDLSSEKIIGKFNASGDDKIDKIKQLSTELVDLINSIEGNQTYK